MGTSKSSPGSPSGAPYSPPWNPDADPLPDEGNGNDDESSSNNEALNLQELIAPPARFAASRRLLGEFARTGSQDAMHRAVGHYVRRGLGGSSTATYRFGGTFNTAGLLFERLSEVADKTDSELETEFELHPGMSSDEVVSWIIERVRPVDGSLDGEASCASIGKALSWLLEQDQDADLLELSEKQILLVVERFVAWDVFWRFELDVGKTIQIKAPSVVSGLDRLEEVRDFIMETVAAAFRKLSSTAAGLAVNKVFSIARTALNQAFHIFEEYL